ncbi:MAG: hypothetical protein ABJB03_08950, partial [Rhodoglobus sp.]
YTEALGDGSRSGVATTDPAEDSDTASGGEPDDAQTPRTKASEVDLETGTDPDGTPTENPAG